MRPRLAALIIVPSLLLVFVFWHLRASSPAGAPPVAVTSPVTAPPGAPGPATAESAPTAVYAHNLMLRKGPDFRIYVRWLRGNMVRTSPDGELRLSTIPSPFARNQDRRDPRQYRRHRQLPQCRRCGKLAANGTSRCLPMATRSGSKGTLHKLIPLPVELLGTVVATPDNRIQAASHKALGPENSVKGPSRWIAHHGRRPYPSQGHSRD